MSGGGSHGAWEAGVIWGLTHYGESGKYDWDVVTGISAGSINAAFTAGWAKEDSVEMTEHISDLWSSILSSDIWQFWPEPV